MNQTKEKKLLMWNLDDIEEAKRIHEEKWTQAKRDEYKKSNPDDFAGPSTSFPISDEDDVRSAATLHGHADDPEAVKSKIKSIAKRKGLTSGLPDAWKEERSQEHTEIRESCQIMEAIAGQGHAVRVTVLRGGRSNNGYHYDENALQEIARLIEGAQAYADHGDPSQTVRSVRDLERRSNNQAA